ncbi:MAG: hypothetical protein C4330_09165 [Chitinophagaceae bacterium]
MLVSSVKNGTKFYIVLCLKELKVSLPQPNTIMNRMKMVRHITAATTQVNVNVVKPNAPVIISKAESRNTDPSSAVNK